MKKDILSLDFVLFIKERL